MKTSYRIMTVVACVFSLTNAQAMFDHPTLERVPTDRLLQNLESQLPSLEEALKEKQSESDLLQPGEAINLYLRENSKERIAELPRRRLQIDADGRVSLPGTKREVAVADLTVRDAGKALEAAYRAEGVVFSLVHVNQPRALRPARPLVGETVWRRYAVARLHSMVYARGRRADNWWVTKEQGYHSPGFQVQAGWPWFSNEDFPMRRVWVEQEGAEQAEAQRHLREAIRHYRVALQLDRRHLPSLLGLGWCLEQNGDKPEAIVRYRMVLNIGWEHERSETDLELGGSWTEEAAHYLLKLLDPEKDAEEIKRIEGLKGELRKKRRWMTPIMIPLGEECELGELVEPEAEVSFDLDGSGLARRWGWITPKAGWLVYCRDIGDPITSGIQMVGERLFWVCWANGYVALSALDDDGDGIVWGSELEKLAVWQDLDGDGCSDPGEVCRLAYWGITALSCSFEKHPTGIAFSPRGALLRDGRFRPTYDWVVPSHE